MKIVYITMGRYGMFCTVGGETKDDRTSGLTSALEELGESVKVIETEQYSYVIKRMDSLSFLFSDDEETNFFPDPLKLKLPGVRGITTVDKGIGVFLASTGWGKTTYMVRGLLPSIIDEYGDESVNMVNFGEPFENFGEFKTNIVFRAVDLLKVIADFLNSSCSALIIDSFRPFLYDQSVGTTGERGMDAFLPVQLTGLSNVLAVCDKSLFVSLNPMIDATTDQEMERYERLQGSIESSVPFVLTGAQIRSATLSLRGFHNPDRTPKTFTVPDLAPKSFPIRNSRNQAEVEMTVSLSPDDDGPLLPAADVRRFINHTTGKITKIIEQE